MMAQTKSKEDIEFLHALAVIEQRALREKQARHYAKLHRRNRRKQQRANNELSYAESVLIMIVLASASTITFALYYFAPSH